MEALDNVFGGETMAVGLGMSLADNPVGKKKIVAIDPILTRQLAVFYRETEPLFTMLSQTRNDLVFHGGVGVEWGGGGADPIRLDSPSERNELINLFSIAMDYRDVYGLIPVKLRKIVHRRSNQEQEQVKIPKRKAFLEIPPFGSGQFFIVYDKQELKISVVYRVPIVPSAGRGRASKNKTYRELPCFIFPGCEPSLVTRQFRSRVASVLPYYIQMEKLRANMLAADFRMAHPVVFTQTRPDNRNIQDMTEDELLGLADGAGPGTEQNRRYQRDVHRAIQTEQMAAVINSAAREGTLAAPLTTHTYDPNQRRVIRQQQDQVWDGAIQPLPIGEEMARAVMPQHNTQLQQQESRYEDLICKVFGIPAQFISGASGFQRMKGESEQLKNNVRKVIEGCRNDIDSFYSWAYGQTHRTYEDQMLVSALLIADDAEMEANAAFDTAEKARLHAIRTNIQNIAAMPFRTRVVFHVAPLHSFVDPKLLDHAMQMNCITDLEYSNMVRSNFNLPPVETELETQKRMVRKRKVDSPQRQEEEEEE